MGEYAADIEGDAMNASLVEEQGKKQVESQVLSAWLKSKWAIGSGVRQLSCSAGFSRHGIENLIDIAD